MVEFFIVKNIFFFFLKFPCNVYSFFPKVFLIKKLIIIKLFVIYFIYVLHPYTQKELIYELPVNLFLDSLQHFIFYKELHWEIKTLILL